MRLTLGYQVSPTEQFVRCFVVAERQDRYIALASKPSRRSDFLWALAHDGRHLEPAYMLRLQPHQVASADVGSLLKSFGASTKCFAVAAEFHEFDGQETSTAVALEAIAGKQEDCILFFPESKLAYYMNHEGEHYVLRR
jgi:hypothetical protein